MQYTLTMFHFIEQIIQQLSLVNPFLAYTILFAIIFAETGLMIGFFLPGDSLLFTVGFLSSQLPNLDIKILCISLFAAAVIGDSVGYAFGNKLGKRIFKREDSFFFHKNHLLRAERFYEKHGGKTIILARFIPAIRTFAPIVAGAGNMKYSKFLFYNITGGLLWTVGLLLAGYYLGKIIPSDKFELYIITIVFAIVLLSVIPALFHTLKDKEKRTKITYRLRAVRIRSKQ